MTLEGVLKEFPETTAEDWRHHSNGGGWIGPRVAAIPSAYLGYDVVVFGDVFIGKNVTISGRITISGRDSYIIMQ